MIEICSGYVSLSLNHCLCLQERTWGPRWLVLCSSIKEPSRSPLLGALEAMRLEQLPWHHACNARDCQQIIVIFFSLLGQDRGRGRSGDCELLNFVVFARFLALTAKVWQVNDHQKRQELTMNESKTTLFRSRKSERPGLLMSRSKSLKKPPKSRAVPSGGFHC